MTDARYIDLVDGINKDLWITAVKFEAGTPVSPKLKIKLTCAALPTKESYTSPYTIVTINVPSKEDSVQARIMLDERIKRTLFPLVGFEPGNDEEGNKKKLSFKQLTLDLKAGLDAYDYKVNIMAKSETSDKLMDAEGNPRKFVNVLGLELVGYEEKGEYQSDLDYDV